MFCKKQVVIIMAMFGSLLVMGCSVIPTKQQLFNEPTIEKREVNIRRIAIVPNRLPLNLTDPEKWRKYCWEQTAKILTANGYEVADYQSSLTVFNTSGLPLEDTKTSPDKYANCAQKLGVDCIITPYYGTFSSAKSALILTEMKWTAIATFQFYLYENDQFFSRIDMSGTDSYISGLLMLEVFLLNYISPAANSETFSLSLALAFAIDFANTMLVSDDSRYRGAFKAAIKAGLKPFMLAFPPRTKAAFQEETQTVPGQILSPVASKPVVNKVEPDLKNPKNNMEELKSNVVKTIPVYITWLNKTEMGDGNIDEVVDILKSNGNASAIIYVWVDVEGDGEYNIKIANLRCKAIVEKIVKTGINEKRLSFTGKVVKPRGGKLQRTGNNRVTIDIVQ